VNTIKRSREAAALTQEELAQKLGVDRTTVTKWETGKAFPKAKMLPALSKVLKVSIEHLLKTG
jgi:transcriptional regulator with XRE-family HTH domain